MLLHSYDLSHSRARLVRESMLESKGIENLSPVAVKYGSAPQEIVR